MRIFWRLLGACIPTRCGACKAHLLCGTWFFCSTVYYLKLGRMTPLFFPEMCGGKTWSRPYLERVPTDICSIDLVLGGMTFEGSGYQPATLKIRVISGVNLPSNMKYKDRTAVPIVERCLFSDPGLGSFAYSNPDNFQPCRMDQISRINHAQVLP